MASRQTSTRTLRATKTQVATQLQTIRPGLTAAQIISLGKSPDATFWQAQLSASFSAFGSIEQKIDIFVEFDSAFLITNLISAVDPTVTASQILDIAISPSDSTKIEITLKRA